jgi:Ca2+/Na+ antiporter
MLLYIAVCLVGFVLLYFGAEWLVKGSSSLARSLGFWDFGPRIGGESDFVD